MKACYHSTLTNPLLATMLLLSTLAYGNGFDHPFFRSHSRIWIEEAELTSLDGKSRVVIKATWTGTLDEEKERFRIMGRVSESPIGEYTYSYEFAPKGDKKYAVAYRDSAGKEFAYALELTSKSSFLMSGKDPNGRMRAMMKGRISENRITRDYEFTNEAGTVTHKSRSVAVPKEGD